MASEVASSGVPYYAARLRSYILRLPLFTRCILVLIVLVWIAQLQMIWNVTSWGSLQPSEVGLQTSMYTPLVLSLVESRIRLCCKGGFRD